MGVRVAQSLSYPMVSRYMALNDDHYLVKVEITENLAGTRFHSVMDHVPEVRAILHKREQEIIYSIDPNLILQDGDVLVIEGSIEPLRRLSKHFNAK